MILTDWEIRQYIEDGKMEFDPYDPSMINPSSMDIRLGSSIGVIKPTGKFTVYQGQDWVGAIDPSDKESFTTEWQEIKDFYVLQPKAFVLAPMYERMKLPKDIQAKLMGKSSIGRLSIINSSHAGLHDNSFAGYSTMELYNCGDYPIILRPKMRIGQFVFYETEIPDATYEKTGRYQNQEKNTGSFGLK